MIAVALVAGLGCATLVACQAHDRNWWALAGWSAATLACAAILRLLFALSAEGG